MASAWVLMALLQAGHLCAQDTTHKILAPVIVTVVRDGGRPLGDLPYAVSSLFPDSARPGQRHSSLEETLFLVPGLSVFNRNNPAQDPRIAIRGFGARSSFGVRGIRVTRDGIPLTLPDGQTPVDYLDLENVASVEVMRGSASSLYGNAAGGVISIHSSRPAPGTFAATAKLWSGEAASRRLVGITAGGFHGITYSTDVTRYRTDGSRAHSRQQMTTAALRATSQVRGIALALSVEGFRMPVAENPGALTTEQLAADPAMADPLAVRKGARKDVSQSQIGLTAKRALRGGEVGGAIYAGRRDLDNPLTFAIVGIARNTTGADVRLAIPTRLLSRLHRVSAGAEIQKQNDLRRNFTNCRDSVARALTSRTCPDLVSDRGSLTLDQREIVSATGAYLGDEVQLTKASLLAASVRADAVRFTVRDRLVTPANPDDSGSRSLYSVSPMIGVSYRLLADGSRTAYFNVASAFETPTATELGNHPDGSAGINSELNPQRSLTWECGLKGTTHRGGQYSVAVFATSVKDELIPFEIVAGSGRRYFRNAGRTSRRGLEASAAMRVNRVDVGGAYTYNDFQFSRYSVAGVSYDGSKIPGIPSQQLQLSATLRGKHATLVADESMSGRVMANDANTASAAGFAATNIRAVLEQFGGKAGVSFIVGVQNVFDRRYASSVSVNASGGKYYEPGASRSAYVGVTVNGALSGSTISSARYLH